MPRYTYRCDLCKEEFVLVHSMKEKEEDCLSCGKKKCLSRIPSLTLKPAIKKAKQKPGLVVKEYIETVKKEVRDEKKSLRKREAE